MRTDAYIYVVCDRCTEELEVPITATVRGWDDPNVTADIERDGWKCVDGKDFCPDCVSDMEDPTLYCVPCGARKASECACGPIAENE